MSFKIKLITLIIFLTKVCSYSVEGQSSLIKACARSYSVTCLKLDIANFVERLSEDETYPLLPGLSIIRDQVDNETYNDTPKIVAELAKSYPTSVETRIDAFLGRKIESYLKNHSIRLKLFDPAVFNIAQNFMGRKMKEKSMLQMIITGLMVIKGTLVPIGMGALAMMASKALMVGLIALLLSSIIGIRSIIGSFTGANLQSAATYEIISKTPIIGHASSAAAHENVVLGGYKRRFAEDNGLQRR